MKRILIIASVLFLSRMSAQFGGMIGDKVRGRVQNEARNQPDKTLDAAENDIKNSGKKDK